MNKKQLMIIGVASIAALALAGCSTSTPETTTTTTTTVVTTGGVQVTPAATQVAGTITTRIQGKDGLQLVIKGDDGKEYSTAVSIISDTIVNGGMENLTVGTHVVVSADEMLGTIIKGNVVEIK